MQETHNIRIDSELKDLIRLNGERYGNAWTKQMRLDLEALYSFGHHKTSPFGEPAHITAIRSIADSLGMSVYELCTLTATLINNVRTACQKQNTAPLNDSAMPVAVAPATTSGVDMSGWFKQETARFEGVENQNMGEN